jgi:hypothetical protein
MYDYLRLVEGMSHKKAKERIVCDTGIPTRSFSRYLENNGNAPHRHRRKFHSVGHRAIAYDHALYKEKDVSWLKSDYYFATHHLRKREEVEAACNDIYRSTKECQTMAKNYEEHSMLLDSCYGQLLNIVLGLVGDTDRAVERLSKALAWKEQEIQSLNDIRGVENHQYHLATRMADALLVLQEKRSEIQILMTDRRAC